MFKKKKVLKYPNLEGTEKEDNTILFSNIESSHVNCFNTFTNLHLGVDLERVWFNKIEDTKCIAAIVDSADEEFLESKLLPILIYSKFLEYNVRTVWFGKSTETQIFQKINTIVLNPAYSGFAQLLPTRQKFKYEKCLYSRANIDLERIAFNIEEPYLICLGNMEHEYTDTLPGEEKELFKEFFKNLVKNAKVAIITKRTFNCIFKEGVI